MMAKCIKIIETGEIRRVSDDEAYRQVLAGSACYTTKKAWKRVGRPPLTNTTG